MSVYPTDGRALESAVRHAISVVLAVGSRALTVLTWAVIVAVAAGWVAFWANVVRLHLAFGQATPALATVVVFVLPPVVGLGWVGSRALGLGGARGGRFAG